MCAPNLQGTLEESMEFPSTDGISVDSSHFLKITPSRVEVENRRLLLKESPENTRGAVRGQAVRGQAVRGQSLRDEPGRHADK
jgi:hypothetical protein